MVTSLRGLRKSRMSATLQSSHLGYPRRMGADRALLLIHGLGATGRVWDGWQPLLPAGSLAPDLPGHGSAGPLDEYTFAAMTAGLAATLDDSTSYVVIGHSLGGVVGLELASGRYGVRVDAVLGLGIKVEWAAAESRRRRPWPPGRSPGSTPVPTRRGATCGSPADRPDRAGRPVGRRRVDRARRPPAAGAGPGRVRSRRTGDAGAATGQSRSRRPGPRRARPDEHRRAVRRPAPFGDPAGPGAQRPRRGSQRRTASDHRSLALPSRHVLPPPPALRYAGRARDVRHPAHGIAGRAQPARGTDPGGGEPGRPAPTQPARHGRDRDLRLRRRARLGRRRRRVRVEPPSRRGRARRDDAADRPDLGTGRERRRVRRPAVPGAVRGGDADPDRGPGGRGADRVRPAHLGGAGPGLQRRWPTGSPGRSSWPS